MNPGDYFMFAENSANKKSAAVPMLCVDFDGTLLATDMLWESILRLVKQKRHLVLALPFCFVKRQGVFETPIDSYISIDPTTLCTTSELGRIL
jgi:hypothetical protein